MDMKKATLTPNFRVGIAFFYLIGYITAKVFILPFLIKQLPLCRFL